MEPIHDASAKANITRREKYNAESNKRSSSRWLEDTHLAFGPFSRDAFPCESIWHFEKNNNISYDSFLFIDFDG